MHPFIARLAATLWLLEGHARALPADVRNVQLVGGCLKRGSTWAAADGDPEHGSRRTSRSSPVPPPSLGYVSSDLSTEALSLGRAGQAG